MATTKPMTRKRSDTRQRQAVLAARLHPREADLIREHAANQGLSVSEFMRSIALESVRTA